MGYRSVFRPGLFAGQTVVVTGGGSGIGRCTAHELASLGAHVVLVGRKRDKLTRVQAELREDGFESSAHACDIRDEEAVRGAVADVLASRGRIHALVNNAGGQFPAPLAAIGQKGFEAVVRTNLTGGFLVAREVVTRSMADHGGAVVNIVADMWRGMPGMGHSGAARAGMVNLTQTMAVEWAPLGIRVNAVAPGWIASSGLDHYDEEIRRTVIPRLAEAVPLKRLGTEAEVSAAICFLLSEAAAFVTGACLRVDGAAPLFSALFPSLPVQRSEAFQGFHRAEVPEALHRPGDAGE
ncbi:MAG TPA: SDR family oxidoreductase [Anaeromyxobacteraceae bacterium]|nr:SDR family oxidoreductase [Anaeromyxobacteraceae bacterium]